MQTLERCIGYTLKRLLEEHEMSGYELAERSDGSRMNVSALVRGQRRMPRLETAYDYAAVFGLDLNGLWKECERDWRTASYAKWLDLVNRKYKRGRYAETGAGTDSPHPSCELVAGEGVEPPTQGFSVSRLALLSPIRLFFDNAA